MTKTKVQIPSVFEEMYVFFKAQGVADRIEYFLDWVESVSIRFDNHVRVPTTPLLEGLAEGVDVVKMRYNKKTQILECVSRRHFISWSEAQQTEGNIFQTGMGLLANMAHRRVVKPAVNINLSGPEYLTQVFEYQHLAVLLATPFHQSNYGGNQRPSLVEVDKIDHSQSSYSFDVVTGNVYGLDENLKDLAVDFVNQKISDYYNENAWETSFEDVEEIKAFKASNESLAYEYGLEICTFYDGDFPERVRRKVAVIKRGGK